jgi:GNAT superfamily N-acetyltransferase
VSGSASLTPDPRSPASPPPRWRVRPGQPEDVVGVAAAVADLLVELGATPPPQAAMRDTAQALLEDPGAGAVLVAETRDELIGVLSVSWQIAMHVPGRYGLIQDLWVERSWRSRSVGAALLDALEDRAREQGIDRLEVGLPKASFAGLGATAEFYRANGFDPLGPRMRRLMA